MEPLAIVTGCFAFLYFVSGGSQVVAPIAAYAFLRRQLRSSPARLRIFGCLLLIMIAVPLIVTARQARAEHGDVTYGLEGFGWYATAAMAWVIVAPRAAMRLADAFWGEAPQPGTIRALGALGATFGLFLGRVAYSVA